MQTKKIILHSALFIITLFTTTVAGVAWLNRDPFELGNFTSGFSYSISILFILTCHEFGHYFAAKYHNVSATLPYYIPAPSLPGFLNFGTFGAVIRTKSVIPSKKVMFDIGVAGPIAGFIATMGVLIYGFTHLPGKEFITSIHPDYFTKPSDGIGLAFGHSMLFDFLTITLTDPLKQFVPPMTEIYHYPFLCTGWFGLFVTAMNLIPIGQLDGGHLSYAMFGEKHKIIATIAFAALLGMGIAGWLPAIGITTAYGWSGWLFWALILFFIVKLHHPSVEDESELDANRRLIGWATLGIFFACFAPIPFTF